MRLVFFRIRPLYVFEKTVAFMGTFLLLYTVTESFILPLTPTSDQSFLRSLLDLSLPFMLAYLLLFYIIFGEGFGGSLFAGCRYGADLINFFFEIQNAFAMGLQSFLGESSSFRS